MSAAFVKEQQQEGGVVSDYSKYGYREKTNPNTVLQYCKLTIGSIIRFNGKKCIVTHTDREFGNRDYRRAFNKATIDITASTSGFLKDLDTNKEFRANWSTLSYENILYYET